MIELVKKFKQRIIEVEDEKGQGGYSPSYGRYLDGHLDAYNNALYLLETFVGGQCDKKNQKEKE